MIRSLWPFGGRMNNRNRDGFPTPVSSNRWRLLFASGGVQGSSNWLSIAEVEMRGSYGGADQCAGGTPVASATGAGNVASRAFDNNTGTMWQLGRAPIAGDYLEYQFAAPVFVHEVSITNASDVGDSPIDFTVQYYDGANWITVRRFYNFKWGLVGQEQRFPLFQNIAVADAKLWRIRETKKQNPGSFSAWAELQFRSAIGGADLTASSRAIASSQHITDIDDRAFDNNTGTRWNSNTGTLGAWIGCVLAAAAEIIEIVATSSSTPNDSVISFLVEYYDGTPGWKTHWTVDTTNWTATLTRTFAKP